MSTLHQPTPTQRQAAERRRAFHASIAARAAERLQAPPRVIEIKAVRALPPSPPPPAPTQELPPQAFPAEPDPPTPPWFWMVKNTPFNSIDVIQRIVCQRFEISLAEIRGPRRNKELVRPRQIAMYLCQKVAQKTYPDIARRFGDRDHTTAIASVRRISLMMSESEAFAETVNDLVEVTERKLFK